MRFNSILLRSTGNSDRLLKKYHINQQNIKKLKKKKHESREFIGKFIYEKHCACCNFPKKKKTFPNYWAQSTRSQNLWFLFVSS
jgi:hypothetical protein